MITKLKKRITPNLLMCMLVLRFERKLACVISRIFPISIGTFNRNAQSATESKECVFVRCPFFRKNNIRSTLVSMQMTVSFSIFPRYFPSGWLPGDRSTSPIPIRNKNTDWQVYWTIAVFTSFSCYSLYEFRKIQKCTLQ